MTAPAPSEPVGRLVALRRDVVAGTCDLADALLIAGSGPLPGAAEVAAVVAELADPFGEGTGHAVLAELALAAGTACATGGQNDHAERLLGAGLRVLAPTGGEAVLRARVERASLWDRAGRPAEVAHETEGLADEARRSGNQTLLGRALLLRGAALAELGRPADALGALDEALAVLRRCDQTGTRTGACQHRRAQVLAALKQWDAALRAADGAVAIFDQLGAKGARKAAEQQRTAIANRMRAEGPVPLTAPAQPAPPATDWSPAHRLDRIRGLIADSRYRAALAALDDVEPEARDGRFLALRGEALRKSDRPADALAVLDEAVRLLEGAGEPLLLGTALWERGNARADLGAEGPALTDLNRAVAALDGHADPLTFARCRRARAEVLLKLGRYPEGAAELDEVLPELVRSGEPEESVHARASLGIGLHRIGHSPAAVAVAEEALADARRLHLEGAVTGCLLNLSSILAECGRAREAVPYAFEAAGRMTDDDHPEARGGAFLNLGAALLNVGRTGEAVVAFESAAGFLLQPPGHPKLAGSALTHLG
ncbi:MAG TPA: hypothetical protein VGE74_00015, partial [Gemmata sp.]